MTAAVYARLRATDPARWHAVAQAWREWAALAGRLAGEFAPHLARLAAAWSGAAATAAAEHLIRLRRRLVQFRLICWQADQATSEFAATLDRARALLSRALAGAAQEGLSIDDSGTVRRTAAPGTTVPAPIARSAAPRSTTAPRHRMTSPNPAPSQGNAQVTGVPPGDTAQATLAAALAVAARGDSDAAAQLHRISSAGQATPVPPGRDRPACTASPAEVRRWWDVLTPAQQQWLLGAEPAWLAPLDGIPAVDRDAANRLLLDQRRDEVNRALASADGRERKRLIHLRGGLDALADRLADQDRPRAYLLRLDLTEEGRAVVALGDPDRADNVLTHVPGMTADLASLAGELSRAERVTVRATELGPAASTSAVLWLDYDAPDFIDEAASARQAAAGAPALRHFQEGLRATHDRPVPARQTVLGHSYGSLVVGKAAAGSGMAADSVVFVGSPGVGVESADRLHVPAGQVWSSTSRSDVIQYVAMSPGSLVRDLGIAGAMPVSGLLAFGLPERDVWFGRNPSDTTFGAHVFTSQADGGHLGYWDRGRPALDALASITLGIAP
jgi:hypothetical protein